jgi:hypothetical protein
MIGVGQEPTSDAELLLLAASDATGLCPKVVALVPDFRRFPVDAVERRDAFWMSQADAAVVVSDERNLNARRVLRSVRRREPRSTSPVPRRCG